MNERIFSYINSAIFAVQALIVFFFTLMTGSEILNTFTPKGLNNYPFGSEGPVPWYYMNAEVYFETQKLYFAFYLQSLISGFLLYFSGKKPWANLVLLIPLTELVYGWISDIG